MRLIDADALDRAFSKLRFNNDGELEHYGDRPNWYLWGSEVENLIAEAPSIDIVRCKECKWRGEEIESGNPYHWCRLVGVGYEVDDIHFCSYGERRGQ